MKTGDLVVGKPTETDGPEKLPAEVVGRLEIAKGSIGDSTWNTYLVYVLDKDGDQIPVEVSSLRLATRRQEVTVL
jgi:hypothetical protein